RRYRRFVPLMPAHRRPPSHPPAPPLARRLGEQRAVPVRPELPHVLPIGVHRRPRSALSGTRSAAAPPMPPGRHLPLAARRPSCAMVRCWPSTTAVAPVNATVPKLSRGSTCRRPAEGDSSTHSAEEREDW